MIGEMIVSREIRTTMQLINTKAHVSNQYMTSLYLLCELFVTNLDINGITGNEGLYFEKSR